MILHTDGVFSGSPVELGTSSFTVRVTDQNGDTDEADYSVDVVLVLPPPDIRLHKMGTTPVPGRIVDYFIVVHNIGDVTARDIEVGEPLNLQQVSLIPIVA